MKTLKISTLAIAFLGLSIAAKAQTSSTASSSTTPVRFSIGVDAGLPTGNISNSYNWNLGGSLQADIPVANQLFVTVNAGYNNIFGKNNATGTSINGTTITTVNYSPNDFHLIPVKAGLKFFPVSNFYIQGEAGAAFLLNKNDVGATKSTAFVYAPQIGVQFPVGGSNYIDAGVRYEGTTKYTDYADSKISFVGVRVAYAFNL